MAFGFFKKTNKIQTHKTLGFVQLCACFSLSKLGTVDRASFFKKVNGWGYQLIRKTEIKLAWPAPVSLRTT